MATRYWYDPNIQPFAEDGQTTAARNDDDEALDDWLASMNAGQFEGMMNFLMDHIGGASSAMDRPVA
jgi:hypothetical protein